MANYTQANGTIQVKVGQGKLYGIFVAQSGAGTLTIYDSATGNINDPKITEPIPVTAATKYLDLKTGLNFNKGLYIVSGTAPNSFTVVYE